MDDERINESTMLRDVAGALAAMETVSQTATYEVIRKGKKLFSFSVSALDDEQVENCRDQSTKNVKDRRLGNLAVPRDFNSAKFNSLMIYTATVSEDKKVLWDNKALWQKAGVVTGWQLVDKVLLRGEKDAVISLVEELSGYKDEDSESTQTTLKNL